MTFQLPIKGTNSATNVWEAQISLLNPLSLCMKMKSYTSSLVVLVLFLLQHHLYNLLLVEATTNVSRKFSSVVQRRYLFIYKKEFFFINFFCRYTLFTWERRNTTIQPQPKSLTISCYLTSQEGIYNKITRIYIYLFLQILWAA